MKRAVLFACAALLFSIGPGSAQDLDSDPVFEVELSKDRSPAVAGEDLRVAVAISIQPGWHVNTDDPGDEFSWPTSVEFEYPEGWLAQSLKGGEIQPIQGKSSCVAALSKPEYW